MTLEELKTAHARKLPFTFEDPVLARTALRHHATFFPLGFPIELHTNSPEVLDCAAESWLGYPQLFHQNAIQLRVMVHPSDTLECPPSPSIQAHGHLLVNVADPYHYSVIDLQQQFAFICVTAAALHHRSYFRYFFLESAALSSIATRQTTAIHAACVELDGKGILLCGDSGTGKSTLAYACAHAGWTYITDDASFLVHGRTDRLVVGNFRQVRFRPSAVALFPSLGGSPIMCRAEVGKPSIEIFTSSERKLKRAPTSHVQHIVFLQRKRVRRPQLVRFPREIARHYILQTNSWLPSIQTDNPHEIDALLRLQPVELRYHDLDWAIDCLNELVQQGHK